MSTEMQVVSTGGKTERLAVNASPVQCLLAAKLQTFDGGEGSDTACWDGNESTWGKVKMEIAKRRQTDDIRCRVLLKRTSNAAKLNCDLRSWAAVLTVTSLVEPMENRESREQNGYSTEMRVQYGKRRSELGSHWPEPAAR